MSRGNPSSGRVNQSHGGSWKVFGSRCGGNHLGGAGKGGRDRKGDGGGGESGQSEEEHVLQEGPEVLRPKHQDVSFSNRQKPKKQQGKS